MPTTRSSVPAAFVVFRSSATLVPNDMNGYADIFLRGPIR